MSTVVKDTGGHFSYYNLHTFPSGMRSKDWTLTSGGGIGDYLCFESSSRIDTTLLSGEESK